MKLLPKQFNPLLLASVLLTLVAIAYLGKGLTCAWSDGSGDLHLRELEWSDFSKQIYPNKRFTPEGKPPATSHSVYPPYALVMFGGFLGSGDFRIARITLETMSAAGIAAMMVLGWSVLRPFGWQAGFLGIAMGPAISGNCSALALGQFSIISSGLIAAQIILIRKNLPSLAGVCWAFAMIKPQIAAPFALLFLIRDQLRGLMAGSIILAVLSVAALAWTGWSLHDYLTYSLGAESFSFVQQVEYSPTSHLPISPKMVLILGAIILFIAGRVLLFTFKGFPREALLCVAGFSSMLGFVGLYHLHYDNQMLFPLILAVTALALRDGRIPTMIASCLLGLTIYLPAKLVFDNHYVALLAYAAPVIATGVLLISMMRPQKALSPKNHQA
jgi:hypothetical protein